MFTASAARRIPSTVVMERPATPAGPIGLVLPTFKQGVDPRPDGALGASPPSDTGLPRELTTLCRDAEELGAGALWACDHLFWHGPTLECLTALTLAACATEQASIGTCVLQLPLRRAMVVAKQAATIQAFSGGRFILGVGVGSHAGEYERAGVDYHRRGRALDAGIDEMRRLWRPERESADGSGSSPDDPGEPSPYRQLPEPSHVPVWVGGSSAAARRRAARQGDGWLPLFLDPVRYEHDVTQLAKETVAAGRGADEVTPAMVLFVSVDDDPVVALRRGTRWMSSMYAIPAKAFERQLVSGTARDVADVITSYRQAGAEHVAVYVTDDRPIVQFDRVVAALTASRVPVRG
jgi:alkanesulfonate monooxygenase SsuD/methylene tetrahydromethanopterin reductase-like flavin-dependent oxidoreductase (luciferase family)